MLKLFSGSAHPILSKEVAKLLKVPISKAEVVRFNNSEVKVTIQEDVKNDYCVIIQPTANPTDTNIMELSFFCDALKRNEAARVVAVIPYFGYARQNIAHRMGESVSVHVVIRLFEAVGFNKILTYDIHDEGTGGVFSIPFRNLTAFPLLAQNLLNYCKNNKISKKDIVFVSPDQGAVEKVRKFGTEFYGTEQFKEVVIEKKRDQNVLEKATPYDLYGNVKGKIAVIVDDMIASGSTMLPAIDLCLERGAKEVYAAIVHHDFSKEAPIRLQNSKLKKVFATNTIPLKKDYGFAKLEEISIAPLIAEELRYLLRFDKYFSKS